MKNSNKVFDQLAALKDNPKFVIVMVIMIFILDIGLILRGQLVSLGGMFKEAKKVKANILDAHTDAKFFMTYKTNVADLNKQLDTYNKMVILNEDLPGALESITKFADMSGVKIFNIKPVTGASVQEIPATKGAVVSFVRQKVSISAKGGYHQLGRFMALLEDAPVFFDIKSLEIQTDQQEYTKHLVTIVLEVVIRKA
jgi:Tfp pilus assembly protein PilO